MPRRFAKIAAILIAASGIVTISSCPFVEAVEILRFSTFVSEEGVSNGTTLTVGDKIFSNFSFGSAIQVPSGTTPNFPEPGDIEVTPSAPNGVVTLTFTFSTAEFPSNMSAIAEVDAAGVIFGEIALGFDVTVTGSDRITGVGVAASGDLPVGPAPTGASVTVGVSGVGNVVVGPQDADVLAIGGLQTIEADVRARVEAAPGVVRSSAEIDEVILTFQQASASAVPEPGVLTLILGGVGILLARGVYSRAK